MTKVRYYVDRCESDQRAKLINQFKQYCLKDLLRYGNEAQEIEICIYPVDKDYEIEINVFKFDGDVCGYYETDATFEEVTRAEDCYGNALI